MFMNTQQKGKCLAFPDICKTPPEMLPIPYLNQADAKMSRPGCYNVLVKDMPAHNLSTQTMITTGDTQGLEGGIISQTVYGAIPLYHWCVYRTAEEQTRHTPDQHDVAKQ